MLVKTILSAVFRQSVTHNKVWFTTVRCKSCSASSGVPFTMKLESPQFKAILTEEVKILENLFIANGFEIRIAGGAVRDLLVGIQPKDLDFATTATPVEMKELFEQNGVRMINMAGEKHGTITPRINDKENFEVTTLRIDVVTDGRRAEVEFVKDWKLDANRRDLTINSMFLGLDGTVYDYFGGCEDLKKRRVVFVGDAATRIQEDYLRILRYFRIAKNSESHDEATLEALKTHCSGLDRVSGERIWTELHKTLEGNYATELLELMIKLEIGPHIGLPMECDIKELIALKTRLQATGCKVKSITLLCGLLRSTDEFMLFHKRCKLSNADRDLGLFILEHRGDKPNEKPLKPYQMLVICSSNKPLVVQEYVEEVLLYRGEIDLLKEFRKWIIPCFPINGNMIRDSCPTTSGRQVGFLLNKLKEAWAEKDFTPTKEELLELLPPMLETFIENKKQKVR